MASPDDQDEFEKYFRRASRQVDQLIFPEEFMRRGSLPNVKKKKLNSRIKSSDRRGSSVKTTEENLKNQSLLIPLNPHPTDSKDFHNPFSFKNLSVRKSSLKTKGTKDSKLDVENPNTDKRKGSLTTEEMVANKFKEIKNIQEADGVVVRSFVTSPKGLVNSGDSVKKKSPQDKKLLNVKNADPSGLSSSLSSNSFRRRLSEASKLHHRGSLQSHSSATVSDLISANASASSETEQSISLEPRHSIQNTKRLSFLGRPSIEITKCYSLEDPSSPSSPSSHSNKIFFSKPPVKRLPSSDLTHLVVVLGDYRVGKTNLINQFLISEHLAAHCSTPDSANEHEKTVAVLVDEAETQISFMDTNIKSPQELEKNISKSDVSCFLIIYSIVDPSSFYTACILAAHLCNLGDYSNSSAPLIARRPYSVVMVANKSDLVRNRKVSYEESIEMCNNYGCKWMEVSAALNHNTNELLVALVTQLRMKEKRKLLFNKYITKSSSKQSLTSSSSNLISSPSSSSSSTPFPPKVQYFGWFKKLFGFKNKEMQFDCQNFSVL